MSFSLLCQPCLHWQQFPAAKLLITHPKAQTCPGPGAMIHRDTLGPTVCAHPGPWCSRVLPGGTKLGHRPGLEILGMAGIVTATPAIVTTMYQVQKADPEAGEAGQCPSMKFSTRSPRFAIMPFCFKETWDETFFVTSLEWARDMAKPKALKESKT